MPGAGGRQPVGGRQPRCIRDSRPIGRDKDQGGGLLPKGTYPSDSKRPALLYVRLLQDGHSGNHQACMNDLRPIMN